MLLKMPAIFLLLIVVASLTFCSCSSQYWYRSKIRVGDNRPPVQQSIDLPVASAIEDPVMNKPAPAAREAFEDISHDQVSIPVEEYTSAKKSIAEKKIKVREKPFPKYTIPRSAKRMNTLFAVLFSLITSIVYAGLFSKIIVAFVLVAGIFFTIYAFVTFQRLRSVSKLYEREMSEKEKQQAKSAFIHTLTGSAIFIFADLLLAITRFAPIGVLWIPGAVLITIGRMKFNTLVRPLNKYENPPHPFLPFLHTEPMNPNTYALAGAIAILLGLIGISIGLLLKQERFFWLVPSGLMFVIFGISFWLIALIVNWIYE